MIDDSGTPLSSFKVDGGACVSDVMMQFQSDILDAAVFRPKNVETTALGAAFLAGLAVGFWNGPEELFDCWQLDKMFTPKMPITDRNSLYKQWQKAVERSRKWAEMEAPYI